MPTRMSVRRIIRPKNKAPKYTSLKSTTYHITQDEEGGFKMTKTKVKKFIVNKS